MEINERYAQEIVEAGRAIIKTGLTRGTWGNISARHGEAMYITPSGMNYLTMRAEDISVINIKTGEQVAGCKPSSELTMHQTIYQRCEQIHGVVHTHSQYATAFSVAGKEIVCCTEDQAQIIGGPIPCPPFVRAGAVELGGMIVEKTQKGRIFASLIANHGLVALGRSVNEALVAAEISEKSAKIVFLARLLNPDFRPLLSENIAEYREGYLEGYGKGIVAGN